MKREYRIYIEDDRYFPQTRSKRFLFWSKWEKIWKNTNGVYDTINNLNYPHKDEKICREYIEGYDKQKSDPKIKIIPVDLNKPIT